MRSRTLLALISPALILITACTPPVPPEVQAFRDELNVPCGTGEITVSRPMIYTDFVDSYVANYNTACPDVLVTVVDAGEPADVVISESGNVRNNLDAINCEAKIDTPIGYEGSALVYSQSSISELDLSPMTLAHLISGQLATWSDPKLVRDNPSGDFPSDSINVLGAMDLSAVQGFNAWGKSMVGSKWTDLTISSDQTWDADTALNEFNNDNVVGITPLSFALNNSLYVAAIRNPQFETPTYPDLDSLTAGASQMRLDDTTSFIMTPTYDPAKAVTPPLGSDTPNQPWGAVYPVRGIMCAQTTNAETSQAFLRYGVRADEQQSLGSYNLAPIPEDVRLKLAAKLNQGLNIPTDVPIPN